MTPTSNDLYGGSSVRYGNQTPTFHINNPVAKSWYDQPIISGAINRWISTPFPWQEIVYRDALAIGPDKKLAHSIVCMSVPRRNGKTEIQVSLMVVFAVLFGVDVLYNAPDMDLAAKVYRRFMKAATDPTNPLSAYFPGLEAKNKTHEHIIQAFGQNGEKLGTISFSTRGGKGGRGGQYDVVIFDEAQDLTTEQYQRYGPTNAARAKHDRGKKKQDISLTILFGTPPPLDTKTEAVATGMFFRNVRDEMQAQKDLPWESRKFRGRAWIEWGADHVIDKTDEDAWYRYNPSMGYLGGMETHFENAMLDAEAFSVEHLGYWTKQAKDRAIEITSFNRLAVSGAELKEGLKGQKYALAMKNSVIDPKVLHLGIAFRRKDDKIVYEHLKTFYMDEAGWDAALEAHMMDLLKRPLCVSFIVDGSSAPEEAKRILTKNNMWSPSRSRVKQGKVIMATIGDMTGASSALLTAISSRRLIHKSPRPLHTAVEDAKKRKIGEAGFGFQSISGLDVVPLEVCALAVYGIETRGQNRAGDDMNLEGRTIYEGLGAL